MRKAAKVQSHHMMCQKVTWRSMSAPSFDGSSFQPATLAIPYSKCCLKRLLRNSDLIRAAGSRYRVRLRPLNIYSNALRPRRKKNNMMTACVSYLHCDTSFITQQNSNVSLFSESRYFPLRCYCMTNIQLILKLQLETQKQKEPWKSNCSYYYDLVEVHIHRVSSGAKVALSASIFCFVLVFLQNIIVRKKFKFHGNNLLVEWLLDIHV